MKKFLKNLLKSLGFIILVLLIMLGYFNQVEPKCIRTREITITDPDIPKEFDGTKIIFFSDVHCGKFFPPKRVKKLIKKINDRNPDLIILGGDYTGDYHPRHGIRRTLRNIFIHPIYGKPESSTFVKPFFDEAKNLKAPLGVYGVLGNHDYWHGSKELSIQGMKDAGIKFLDNKAYWIEKDGARIKLGGVSDIWVRKDQTLEPTINDVQVNDFTILVSHNPRYAEYMNTDKVDLVLAGHTHRAQFGLEQALKKPEKRRRYFYGLVKDPDKLVYITSGIGEVVFPIRIFAPPEIVEFTLKSEK